MVLLLYALTVLHGMPVGAAAVQKHYYAYDAVEDAHGVIAPWYQGLNGQWDFRVRVAAETLKRYPWTDTTKAPAAVPEYVFNGHWNISSEGVISIPELRDWDNGDLGQRAAYVLTGWVDYYRYTGDPAAIAHLSLMADALLNYCLTPDDHPWPRFLVSVPLKGKPYGICDPRGHIQLDIVAEVGIGLVRAYKLVGNEAWLDMAKHWADLLAEKRDRTPGMPPWGRYANPEDISWNDKMTGGIAFLLEFFDKLIQTGYTGQGGELVAARNAGRQWLRDVLLPEWTRDETWGRNYWDWEDPVQAENVTEFVVRYLIEHQDIFPNWKNDARNILSLFLNRTSVCPGSAGDVYSGAWAYPESSSCCGRSLWYGPLELAPVWAQYGVQAVSPWALEIARRMAILSTYDGHDNGVVEDNIDGGPIVAGGWFKIAHPMALKHVLNAMAWMPEICGPSRENHILRCGSVVNHVEYGKGCIEYETFDTVSGGEDVLRLAFDPVSVVEDGNPLSRCDVLDGNGYTVKSLDNGDFIVTVRHEGQTRIRVEGNDCQQDVDGGSLEYSGDWHVVDKMHVTSSADAAASCKFVGSQVRVIGRASSVGGLAAVYLDGVKQPAPIDCWIPGTPRDRQVLFYRTGLEEGEHELRLVAQGRGNPAAAGAEIYIDRILFSDETGKSGFGEGGGPVEIQRMIFGYSKREDYSDAAGNAWRPATELVARSSASTDVVAQTWWSAPRRLFIGNTDSPELYRYGVHAGEFWTNVSVAPGTYYVGLKFAETRNDAPAQRAVTVLINGVEVATDVDIAATAGGLNRAVDLVFNTIRPQNGIIEVRLRNKHQGEAILQALEVGPGDGGAGANPVCIQEQQAVNPDGNLLKNPGFEEGVTGMAASCGVRGGGLGWNYLVAGPAQCYIWGESGYDIHPEWGLPVYHSGKEALRTHTEGRGHTVVYQEVQVEPGVSYTASVWIQPVDLKGEGFGKAACDSAGLWVQELDEKSGIVMDHPKREVTVPGEYGEAAFTFVTNGATRKLRFLLDTVINCKYDQGHVTYDDCMLKKAP